MSHPDDRSGTTLGHYRLEELLGRGGMGEVYRATDTRKERVVALKLLHSTLAGNSNFRDRFLRESRVAARLNEPHVVPIHDWGEIDGLLFIDMRLVGGADLRRLLTDSGALDPARAVMILGQVADALDAAHESGLVHRDVKPDNILVDVRDFTYLADFGLAQADSDTRLTSTGAAIGSFGYMAPERFGSDEVGAAGDIYALACVLFESVTGTQPFASATNIEQLITAHLHKQPPATGSPLDPVIARGMAKDPAARHATAGELIAAARAALEAPAPQGGSAVSPPTVVPSAPTPPPPSERFPTVTPPPSGRIPSATPPPPSGRIPSTTPTLPPSSYPSGPRPVTGSTSAYAPTGQVPYPPASYPYPAAPAQPRRGSAAAIALGVVAVLLLAGIGIGGWVLLSGDSSSGTAASGGSDAQIPATAATTEATTVTSAPTETATATVTQTATPTTQARSSSDLGLTTPISHPACDGTGIVVVGNAVTPGQYPADIQRILDQYPGSSYLRTDESCGSLRDRDDNGNVIYAVYQVAGSSLADICRLRNQLGGESYGKWLDNTTDPTTFITPSQCGA
ncbi:serine/threonine-protein kinase [Gordonia sp. NB41Y]|uniref:serine/threonine-protein kinase n=1 Tax=Gordonia sp. NB41Y TaxID=875808 RepID=UPI0006B215A8|nr:serine/threonine-protein kinase [Gordonia sp. NB41Y]KOY49455.1 serine/threonine protein kinase [Gordonia sp. NB41Y]WLP90310.1 protein kinase [Gordonia sp. NB41Y]